MKPIYVWLFSSLIFSNAAAAQKSLPTVSDKSEPQKWLKKNLLKEVRAVSKVKFEGCRMTVIEDFSTFTATAKMGVYPRPDFPNNDSSAHLSAGPDRVVSRTKKRKIMFDLTDFDAQAITTQKSLGKDRSFVVLKTSGMKNFVQVIVNKRTWQRPTFEFNVKTKCAATFADAFRQAIRQCQE